MATPEAVVNAVQCVLYLRSNRMYCDLFAFMYVCMYDAGSHIVFSVDACWTGGQTLSTMNVGQP